MVLRRGRHRPPGPLPIADTSHDPGSPKWAHVEHTAPTSTGKGGTRDGEGEKRAAGQQLACPHDCLSLLALIPPWGHHPWWCPGTLSPAFSSLGGAGSMQCWGCSSPSPPGWHLHPVAMPHPKRSASSGKRMLNCAPASSPGEGDGNQPCCPVPALPSGAVHALSGPADRSRGAAGCSTHQTGPPTPPPQGDLLTAPTIGQQLIKPYSHVCPSLSRPTVAPASTLCWGMDGGSRS